MPQHTKSKTAIFLLAAAVVVAISVVALMGRGRQEAGQESTASAAQSVAVGHALMGRALFEAKCSFCHYVDREESKLGPGLEGVLKNANLPSSGRPANPDNIRSQIESPAGQMPSFASLSDREVADILAYLKTL